MKMHIRYFFLFVALISLNTLKAEVIKEIIPVHLYGWLNQYSVNARHGFVADEACVPTSAVNAMTYLQNVFPHLFKDALTGSSYSDWEDAADKLVALMDTTVNVGTTAIGQVYGLHTYIHNISCFREVKFGGRFQKSVWLPKEGFPKPHFITSGKTSINFLFKALSEGKAIMQEIVYSNGAGHVFVVNGLVWDTEKERGTIYFIDPLDSSKKYSPEVPLGPTKQTTGTIKKKGKHLILTYQQYQGQLPFTGVFAKSTSILKEVLTLEVVEKDRNHCPCR